MERHRDNIGALRLLLASLVVIGHAPELMDGDRHREPFNFVFHTLSLGEVAVDGFFLLSGYLITMSWIRTGSLRHYLERRTLRIVPAFAVAYLISVFVLGPLVGAQPWKYPVETLVRLLTLEPPKDYPNQLLGLHYPFLNGALWTISIEFKCYLLAALLGCLGLYARRGLILASAILGLFLMVLASMHIVSAGARHFAMLHQLAFYLISNPGQPLSIIRLLTSFLIGMSVYLFRDEVFPRLDLRTAGLCAIAGSLLMFHDPYLAEVALVTFGAIVLFWAAMRADFGVMQHINDRWDISYGVYLYGWPITVALEWFLHPKTPLLLAVVALPLAMMAGAISWWGVERWTKDLARSRSTESNIAIS